MKKNLGWIMFSIMTVAVIVLASVLISYNVRWKSGNELLDIDIQDVESAYLYQNITSSAEPQRKEYYLKEKQIEYIVTEFHSSRFERSNSQYDGGSSSIVFKLKDGSEISFSVVGSNVTINGKQYKCHSYLTNYITHYGFDEE
ncbi:MAG: hypothetical protein K2L70_01450 [Clostridia bacterium]|nr:hypothetical protein [Clostridia bacterium]